MTDTDYPRFPRIPRLHREVIVTEKLDGTNGLVSVERRPCGESEAFSPAVMAEQGVTVVLEYWDEYWVRAGSRKRWIAPGNDDNHGFAAWVRDNARELVTLGPGNHYGEWFGRGIQRGYDLNEKRFALFNTGRWHDGSDTPLLELGSLTSQQCPKVCTVVPVIATGIDVTHFAQESLRFLERWGSIAAPGYMKPEGVVVYHTAAGAYFKATLENDDQPKGTR